MKIYWITGQPGSGKTSLGKQLKKCWPYTQLVDGDDIREIHQNFDYSENGRRKNVEIAQIIAKYIHKSGNIPIVSMVSPFRDQREEFKKNNDVVEIYLHTTDIRGRESYFFPNYEPPTENFIDIDTSGLTIEESFEKLMNNLNWNIYK